MKMTRIVPMLPVANVKDSLEFYRKLGFEVYGMREFRIDDPDGNRLWIGQAEA